MENKFEDITKFSTSSELGKSIITFSILGFLIGLVSSMLEVLQWDPSFLIDFIQEGIALNLFLYTCTISVAMLLVIDSFSSKNNKFFRVVKSGLNSTLDFGVSIGAASIAVILSFSLGGMLIFSVFDSDKLEDAFKLLMLGIGYFVLWYFVVYSGKSIEKTATLFHHFLAVVGLLLIFVAYSFLSPDVSASFRLALLFVITVLGIALVVYYILETMRKKD
ncbi:hypothetical protein [Cobetia sp. 1CM21F]|uniref:hypothetical protein n=1 Tax=Cobetia sp. 1CM21F TaxID=2929163 RepID=UPI0020BF48ED|nr:hypothetical protein [Cobetia sp. 1CM21F]MCK8066414.1 hypothetical protein [Cobetia sp. 1CM21F]